MLTGGTASDNLIYNNTTAGISSSGGSVLGNVVNGNGLGITASSNPVIENNLLYNNTTGGIFLNGGFLTTILNNTVYQIAGDALQIVATNGNNGFINVRDNIFWDTSAADIAVDAASETHLATDYNDLYVTGAGQVGIYGTTSFSTLPGWQAGSGMDANGISVDPLFVNAAGGDFHEQSLTGSYHGGTLAPILNPGTGLPQANPGSLTSDANQSPVIDRGAPADAYAAEVAPNGNYDNLGAYGDTNQASHSPANFLLVINPLAGQTSALGQLLKVSWRDEITNISAGASKADTIELLHSGAVVLMFSTPDIGSYSFTPPTSLAPGTYQVEVIRTDGTGLSATSGTFNLAAFAGIYYVNGASIAGVFTTAGGSDTNSGLDPAHPKATIAAILAAYTIQPGNIIDVDQATYNLNNNLILTATDSGVVIDGVSGKTILNRGNTNSTGFDIDFQGATGVTLENLSLTGAYYGINASSGVLVTGLTVTGCTFSGDQFQGIDLAGSNGSVVITNNTFDNMLTPTQSYGVQSVNGTIVTFTGNTAFGLNYGLYAATSGTSIATSTISNNTVFNNNIGIFADDGGSGLFNVTNNIAYDNFTGNLQVLGIGLTATGNTAYEDGGAGSKESAGEIGISANSSAVVSNNTVYGNVIGIELGSNPATATFNQVYSNSTFGIDGLGGDVISGNSVYSNGSWGIITASATVSGNLVYGNGSGGIYLSGAYTVSAFNNTVYQTTGPALRLDGLVQNGNLPPSVTLQNNIFWTTSAPDLLINDPGEFSFSTASSDYNDFYATGTGEIAQMAGVNFTSLSAWALELGLDTHGLSANPLFINAAGGNFHVQSNSPTIDAGNPASEFISEPEPNGGRVNLGYDGDTAQAATSAATTVMVTSPTNLQKLQVGIPTTIQWLTTGLLSTQTLTEVAVGKSTAVGEYHAAEFQVGSQITTTNVTTINTTLVTNPAPQAVYQAFAEATNTIGSTLSYQIPVPDGTYTIRLEFVEPFFSSTGSRTFDISLNGGYSAISIRHR